MSKELRDELTVTRAARRLECREREGSQGRCEEDGHRRSSEGICGRVVLEGDTMQYLV